VAFLRGMNLGRRRLTNDELIRCFVELGFGGVGAFLASGNVVFDAKGSAAVIAKRVEHGLMKALKYEVPTFLRSGREVETIAGATPFATRRGQSTRGKVQVAMLRAVPTAAQVRVVAGLDGGADWLAVNRQELYWWPSGGISESELDLGALEKLLGPMTIRTQRTIQRLAVKFFDE
jgi:uncharacterized protein (DUF1697 family)